jgi:hypothetical protein
LCCPLVVHSTLVSKVRSNRKGAVASATSATLGMIFILLAAGYPRAALVGHAAFRMFQILCASNVILDSQGLRSALGFSPWPRIVPDLLYRIAWALRRFDFHVIIFCIELVAHFLPCGPNLEGYPDLSVTAACIILAGAPFTPVSDYQETVLTELIQTHGINMVLHFGVAVLLMRFLFVHVLHPRRFFHHHATVTTNQK